MLGYLITLVWRLRENVHKVYLSMGSNIGNKVDYLDKAVDAFKKSEDIHNVKVSSYYSTDPVGYLNQDEFVNIAVELDTQLNPYDLLDLCHKIENDLDRVRTIRWGPRTIDIDIILYDDIEMNEEELIIPHPRMKERGFVLIPLLELNRELIIGKDKLTDLIDSIKDDGVRKMIWKKEY